MPQSDPIRDLAAATRDLPAASQALADPVARARLLEVIAAALEAARAEIIQTTAEETSLYPSELEPEFDRMTGTLRIFAALVRDGSWVRASIDNPATRGDKSIGPNHDVRKMLVPLGPIAVFGASNFPLAYGVCGGDTASALAAGCPVIVKEHPAHPRTGRLIHRCVRESLGAIGLQSALSYVAVRDEHDVRAAEQIVLHPAIYAVGFTGSASAGASVQRLARGRELPIPVFAEMGSANVVFITDAAAASRNQEIAESLANSICVRVGQQCTRPGLIFLDTETPGGRAVLDGLTRALSEASSRRMLAPWIARAFRGRRADSVLARIRHQECSEIESGKTVLSSDSGDSPMLLRIDLEAFNREPTLHDEIFGPAVIVVSRRATEPLPSLHGSIAASLYHEAADQADGGFAELREWLVAHAGRITFNSVPTGVRVCTSMVHGGPFPATNRPDTTAVGPLAIERWCRPVCLQNCPDALLPPELQNANPLGIWRTVNGQPTREAVRATRT